MNPKELIQLIQSLEGKSLHHLVTAVADHAAHPLPPGRWTAQINERRLGHCVVEHRLGVDPDRGAWAMWKWTQGGKVHTLEACQTESLTLTIDSEDKDRPTFRMTVGTERQFPHLHLVLHFQFDEAGKRQDFRFAGRMN